MRSLSRYLYAPCFCFGFIALATWLIAYRQLPAWLLLPLLAAAIGLSFLLEAWLPYQADWNRPHHDRWRDALHAGVNEGLNLLGIASIPLLAGWLPASTVWPSAWPVWLQLLLAITVADLGITLVHYLSHRNALLWRLHAVHHSVRRLYGFNGLMKHPLHQALEATAGTLPLLLAGLPQQIAALLAFAIAIQLLLQHSNVDMRCGKLSLLFAWAPVHRFHHLKYGRAGDVNFALFFCVWDRLLGTSFQHVGYRLDSQDLGIGDRTNYPDAYLAQLFAPFRNQRPNQPTPELPAALRQPQPLSVEQT
ncbi:MAG: sterol desaturase family protein [Pseudomonas sp.]|uniref:sterol desaturase family protein n=1 Tax=Pseudomonas sp. TaxID=306 RepID=UPI003BB6C767